MFFYFFLFDWKPFRTDRYPLGKDHRYVQSEVQFTNGLVKPSVSGKMPPQSSHFPAHPVESNRNNLFHAYFWHIFIVANIPWLWKLYDCFLLCPIQLQSSLSKAFRFSGKSSRSGSSLGERSSLGNSTSPTPSFSSSEGGGGIYAAVGVSNAPTPLLFHYPPPTTAPPPPPTEVSTAAPATTPTPSISSTTTHYNYLPTHQQRAPLQYTHYGHRISAPPTATEHQQLDLELHRRVKSISDIGTILAPTTLRQSAFKSTSKKQGSREEAKEVGDDSSIQSWKQTTIFLKKNKEEEERGNK